MKRFVAIFLCACTLCFYGCTAQPTKNPTTEETMTNQLEIQLGDNSFLVTLEESETTKALIAWLGEGKSVSSSNYGGFEKILSLGTSLPTNNKQTTTAYGDVMLYNGNQIVIFYESNSWSYTRLGKVTSESDLASILSGRETTAIIKPIK